MLSTTGRMLGMRMMVMDGLCIKRAGVGFKTPCMALLDTSEDKRKSVSALV